MFSLWQIGLSLTINKIVSASLGASSTAVQARQAQNHTFIKTTGFTDAGIGYRREIHVLQQDEDAWNMYLLGLSRLKEVDGRDPMSYYQIAAIHGQPYIAWDNNKPCNKCRLTGYCSHQSTLFPTWHRAYLALFEQALVSNAITVAEQFTGDDRNRYVKASRSLRIPFWDWAEPPADGENPFPQMFTNEEVLVNSPNGRMNITNPLSGYKFKVGEEHDFIGGDKIERQPKFTTVNRRQLRSDLWATLSSNQTYKAFSTEVRGENDRNFNPSSLEAIHDNVHVLIGGHMSIVPQAAYDPVFWLHHTNVDRIFAIFQAAYPDQWILESTEVGSSMWYNSDTVTNGASGLEPFHSSTGGKFWASDDLRDTHAFNYIYEDLHEQEVAPLINSLYAEDHRRFEVGSGERGNLTRRAGDTPRPNGYLANLADFHPLKSKNTEYIASIEVNATAVNGSFTVFLFDGDFDEDDSSDWQCNENLIGSHGFFAPLVPMSSHFKVRAGISITDVLSSRATGGFLDDLTNGSVADYLQQRMSWRIVDSDGCIKEAKGVPGLSVMIVSSEVDFPLDNTRLPAWGDFNILRAVTNGKDIDC